MKAIFEFKLKILTRLILRKYQPLIIGISGSMGKSSAQEAIFLLLNKKWKVRRYEHISEDKGWDFFATIIGFKRVNYSVISCMQIVVKALSLLFKTSHDYPEVIILDFGFYQNGGMAKLCAIAPPKIGIVTSAAHSYLSGSSKLGIIKKEEKCFVENIDNKGLTILNFDNRYCADLEAYSHAKILTYGLQAGADLLASDIHYNFSKGLYDLTGLNFKMNHAGSVVPVFMKNVLSETAIYAALAGSAVAIYYQDNLVDIAQNLNDFNLPRGRMTLVPGHNNSFIIDDSYSSSPEACLSALATLASINLAHESQRYAVLGDMLDSEQYDEEAYQVIGQNINLLGIDYLLTIGTKAKLITEAAVKDGGDQEKIIHFDSDNELLKFLLGNIKSGDVILVKGSQEMKMENLIKELIVEKKLADDLLLQRD